MAEANTNVVACDQQLDEALRRITALEAVTVRRLAELQAIVREHDRQLQNVIAIILGEEES